MQICKKDILSASKGRKDATIVNKSHLIVTGMILYNDFDGSLLKVNGGKALCINGKKGRLEEIDMSNLRMDKPGVEKQNVIIQQKKYGSNHKFEIKSQKIIQAAKSGDGFSISLLHEDGSATGKGFMTPIQSLNPDITVTGDPESEANQYISIPIQQSLNNYCLEPSLKNNRIVISSNWKKAVLKGVSRVS